MKNILKFGLLACLATAFVFAGCKKDDDDANNGGGNSGVSILPKKVTKIVVLYTESKGYSHNPHTHTFDSDGKLLSVEHEDYSYYFSYSDNEIVETCKSHEEGKTETYAHKVSNGRIVSMYDGELTFSYSSDGYLASFNDGGDGTKFTINDGKLTAMEEKNKGETYMYKFTYDNTPNNLNVDLSYFYALDGECPGYFGKRLKFLPSSVIEIGGDNDVTTFTYTYDSDYLTRITEQYDDGGKTTYEIFY